MSVIFGQDFVPNNNQSLNQTQIFFKWPQINNSILYRLYINDNQNFYESDSNSIIINDFEWDSAYSWYVCGFNNSNNMIDCYDELYFNIRSLPTNYPANVNILEFNESEYLAGVTLLDYESLGFSVVLDQTGKAIWISDNLNFNDSKIWATQFLLNGNIVGFGPGVGYELNIDSEITFQTDENFEIHHQFYKTKNNSYFFIQAEVQYHPCPDECEPEYPDIIPWQGDKFIEIDELGNILWEWSTFDYLSLNEYNPYWVERFMIQWDFGGNPDFDWTHSNSVYFDEDESIVYVSIRNLSRIIAIDYNTKEILWHIGDSNFMEEVFFDYDFEFSHQHSAQITNNKNLLFFDNGRFNELEVSRCVEIEFDDNFNSAELIWEHVLPPDMLTLSRGECDRLNNGNTLISVGRTGNVLEVNNQNEIVWHLNVNNDLGVETTIYRSDRIPNLYPNIFSFKVNNLFGSYNDNYHISYDDNDIEFNLYNKGWSNQLFVYELLDINENILYNSQIDLSAFSNQNINIPIDSSIEDYYLKVFSLNNESNFQIISFDNNFILGDINDDFEVNIQDIILLINNILLDESYIENGDLNFDSGINILDVINMVNLIIS